MEKIPVLVIAGPTASGKTALAVELARIYNGEVCSADSMQIYKKMDIGTAKPEEAEMCGIPHHMLSVIEPWETFSVADYVKMAHPIILDIYKRGKLPIVAGGTGLYINSLIDDIDFSDEERDTGTRAELERIAKEEGIDVLLKKLLECDPVSAERIHPNNVKRIIRAIEFFELTGKPLSEQDNRPNESRYNPLILMINPEREYLYNRIEKRVDIMLKNGLIEEVGELMAQGLTKKNMSMQGIGYKEVIDYLRGFTTKSEMTRIIKRDTRRYAKRQLTWFRRDERIINISGDLLKEAARHIDEWNKKEG